MSASDNEAVAGRAATTSSSLDYGDRDTIPNSVSGSLEVNPFVGEGGAYDSVRPAYPDEAVAALIDAARSGRGRCVSQRKEISFSVLLSNHRRRPSGSTTS